MEDSRGTRIAKNTVYLYARMILSMIVTLYTSRVVLNALGASDYGVYNVVTGFVVSFGFLNSAMNASVQRFLTIELKNKNHQRMQHIFSMGVSIHLILALLMVVIAEPIGIYFVQHKLVIPPDRLNAAMWIFQFSVVTLFFGIMNVPYRALIVAHENMGAFAGISLIEVFAKLFIAFTIVYCAFDKLFFYGLLLMAVAIVIQIFYMYYCIKHYKEGRYKRFWNKNLFVDMSSFAGWNLIGVFAGIFYNQGVNIVLNLFGGPVINAARAIAFHVSGSANQLVTNFQLAANPPIMKAYASNDKSLFRLMMSSCKLSYILLLFLVIPFLFECPIILKVWLKEVPDYANIFTRLALVDIVVCSLAGPLHTLVQATGTIKKYQMIISGILLLNLPLSYLLLKIGLGYEFTFIISILLSTIALIARFIIMRRFVDFSYNYLLKGFFVPICLMTAISCVTAYLISITMNEGYVRLALVCLGSWVAIIVLSWVLALDRDEKQLFMKIIKRNK